MSIQRWRAAKGDINKIKMEVSARGKWVRYADHLAAIAAKQAHIDELEAEVARLMGVTGVMGEVADRLREENESLLARITEADERTKRHSQEAAIQEKRADVIAAENVKQKKRIAELEVAARDAITYIDCAEHTNAADVLKAALSRE